MEDEMLQPVLALFRNTNLTRVFLVSLLLICISCGTRWPVELAPELTPDGVEKSIVAIKVEKPELFSGSTTASSIYFVRLEGDGQYRQERVYEPNYESDGYSYLVNVSPGKYAAIGAVVYTQPNGPTGPISSSYWCFPESMIDETIITVEPSEVAFMGEFEVSGDLQFDDADETQKHYANLFRGGAPQNAVTKRFRNWGNKIIAEYRKDQSEMATQRFLQSSQLLADVGWHSLMR
jgi:hypothetical protein